ncbi:hypothetical protein C8J56DRAFT_941309 [Mycena floridula]|nr:hypothetical protein C8J56DRAFT_941309 [Mycena floridula]
MSSLLATFSVPPKGLLHGGLWINKTESVYSPSQITKWLERIQYPGYAYHLLRSLFILPPLENLELLMLSSLITFLFENTAMH